MKTTLSAQKIVKMKKIIIVFFVFLIPITTAEDACWDSLNHEYYEDGTPCSVDEMEYFDFGSYGWSPFQSLEHACQGEYRMELDYHLGAERSYKSDPRLYSHCHKSQAICTGGSVSHNLPADCALKKCEDKDQDLYPYCNPSDCINSLLCSQEKNKEWCKGYTCETQDCDDNNPLILPGAQPLARHITNIKVMHDPQYVNKTIYEKKFDPRKNLLTIFDDLLIEIQATTCHWGPESAIYEIFMTIDNWEILAGYLVFHKVSETKDSATYQAKMSSLSYYVNIETEEKIVEETIKSGNIKLRFRSFNEKDKYNYKDVLIPLSNCVQMYGNGNHKIVGIRSIKNKNTFNIYDLIYEIDLAKNDGFNKIDPFKTYNEQFSYYSDLANHYKLVLTPVTQKLYSITNSVDIKKRSNCKDGSIYILYSDHDKIWGGGAYSTLGGGVISIFHNKNKTLLHKYKISRANTVIHETGHGFCKLFDEYLYYNTTYLLINQRTNCAVFPSKEYKGQDNKLYGSINIQGCSWINGYIINPLEHKPSLLNINFYRPSKNSIMNLNKNISLQSSKFNVISCGYCLSSILGGKAKSYWPECENMDTEKHS